MTSFAAAPLLFFTVYSITRSRLGKNRSKVYRIRYKISISGIGDHGQGVGSRIKACKNLSTASLPVAFAACRCSQLRCNAAVVKSEVNCNSAVILVILLLLSCNSTCGCIPWKSYLDEGQAFDAGPRYEAALPERLKKWSPGSLPERHLLIIVGTTVCKTSFTHSAISLIDTCSFGPLTMHPQA
jgi:hypothetical protein